MKVIAIILLGYLCLTSAQESIKSEDCGECDCSDCPKLDSTECVAGIIRDVCECCQLCAQKQDDPCDFVGNPHKFGPCGDNLECRPNGDGSTSGQCSCRHMEMICGSNTVTYKNLCSLMADSIKTEDHSLIVDSMGPCKTAPQIISSPDNQRNKTGGSVDIACEAYGFPIPYVAWLFTRADGETISLPSDDGSISMVARGGPEKMQVTGWLQIIDLEERHEGDYTCIAQNKYGSDQAVARVKVIGPDDDVRFDGPRRGDLYDL